MITARGSKWSIGSTGSKISRLIVAMLAALLLAGCLSGGDGIYDPNARLAAGGGGEDFPNTVDRLGKIAASDVEAASGWEDLQNLELPEVPDIGNLDSLRVEPPLFKRVALRKAADTDSCKSEWTWNIMEFLKFRRIRKITCEDDAIATRRDTLFYYYSGSFDADSTTLPATREEFEAKPDSFVLLVASRGSITWKSVNKVQNYRATNLDSVGGLDLGEFQTLQFEAGTQSYIIQRVSIYGPNGAYLSPTAPAEEFEYLRLGLSRDTLEWKRMRDADGDRAFWGVASTGIVTFERLVRNPDTEPGTSRLKLFMKAELIHDTVTGDNLKRLYYKDERTLRNGRMATFSFLGTDPDSVLRANDTAAVTSDTVFADTDSMKTYHGAYNLLLGPSPEAMGGHALVGFGIEKAWRRGPLRHSTTSFVPPAPAVAGQCRFLGVMTFSGKYANGDTIRTEGTVTPDGMEMDYQAIKNGKAEAFHLVYDINGNSVETVKIRVTNFTGPAAKRREAP